MMLNAEWNLDGEANAIYVRTSEEKIKETKPIKNAEVFFDLDECGRLVGIEILLPEGSEHKKK